MDFSLRNYRIRQAKLKDLEAIRRLARVLNTVNLPDKPEELECMLDKTCRSFSGEITDPWAREYLFVLEEVGSGLVIGTSLIVAQHGSRQSPHVFFQVGSKEHCSATVDRLFKHQTLEIGYNFEGPTEIGGLVVDPEFRRHPQKLGKFLSLVRFLFIKAFPTLFKERLLAEILPPLERGRQPPLWLALGSRFTELDYVTADHISRQNKEFIQNLFPRGLIYTTFFDEAARKQIGAVGKKTEPAYSMLKQNGFKYCGRIDPFDGGPHLEAKVVDVLPVQNTRKVLVKDVQDLDKRNKSNHRGIVASWKRPFENVGDFLAFETEFRWFKDEGMIFMSKETARLLDVGPNDHVWVQPT